MEAREKGLHPSRAGEGGGNGKMLRLPPRRETSGGRSQLEGGAGCGEEREAW